MIVVLDHRGREQAGHIRAVLHAGYPAEAALVREVLARCPCRACRVARPGAS